MAQKSITRLLRHAVFYRVLILDFNITMMLSSKMANFGDGTMVLSDFFDDCAMVISKSKNPTMKHSTL